MTVFAAYSRYYDLFYRDKDYVREAHYVHKLLKQHMRSASTILEIGCGTGAHAAEFARLGYSVTGVDMSEGMLESAESRKSELPAKLQDRLSFSYGDGRSLTLGKTFDAVISLFHVVSYQVSNSDLAAVFATARKHLKAGGVFLFDCWYGPAVLRQWPRETQKKLADETTEVERFGEPTIHAETNVVDVNYTVQVRDRITGAVEEVRETHHMRYLFTPEVELGLSHAGLTLIDSRGWMSAGSPGFDTWGACFVARG